MKTIVFPLFIILALLLSCEQETTQITDAQDYNIFLLAKNEAFNTATKEYNFWNEKFKNTPSQYLYLSKIASANSQLFQATGTIENLIKAEESLLELNIKTDYNKAGYLRALARNYISQHRFKDALELLLKAEANGENLKGTQKMLFDVYLELGKNKKAKHYLETIVDLSDFDYLIRTAKWNDHKGNLTAAIKYMEKATLKAETSKNKSLMQWAYTNLADFYGHDGQIKQSYNHFIKALELNPNDAYAKKRIAWIVYSHERNPEESLRILNTITSTYNTPDYYLLKAEIAEFLKNEKIQKENEALYLQAVKNKNYGDMYNAYNIDVFLENTSQINRALALSKREIDNRATPQSYDLLAWSHLKNGNKEEALAIMEKEVVNKTFEPTTLYHLAEVYKANGKTDAVKTLKKELLEAIYELGPLMEVKIKQL